jgi:photosystem II stability/assembly factor-like uncharacterized protein
MRRFVTLVALLLTAIAGAQIDSSYLNGLRWRLVGPFRGGRALAVTGVPGNPEKYYFGAVGGGVWVTENAGRTWNPIFDNVPVASIGAIAVAPSDPKTIYVGTGEADMRSDIQQGSGMYKSIDGGHLWFQIGLKDSRQIGKILVDPKDPNTVYVAALGHQYGPNAQRGVYKSTNGGQSWAKVLGKDDNTGAVDLAFDPQDSSTIYASLWQTRRPPWSVYPPSNGPGSGLYKSTDAGQTWHQIVAGGFPSQVGRIGLSVSPTQPNRVWACVDGLKPELGGVYRSDDGGEIWEHVGTDPRIRGRGWYFMGITADPKNPDEVYVMNTSAYRSTDGGHTWTAFKGAPGGDDYHTLWINPEAPDHMILGCDQGVVVSVDGGDSWSSWYNQPTGQFYHVVTDNKFPYWIYGSQQDSGAMAVPSRTIHSGVSALYQRPIDAGGESGTIAPDPQHPGLLYSSGGSKEDFDTGWNLNIDPTLLHSEETWRSEWTQPIVNSPADPRVFYTSHQKIFRTDDGGSSWRVISPDLTRPKLSPLSNLDPVTEADHDPGDRRGVVYWLAPSPIQNGLLWAGTDDGLIWVTSDDGANWRNVTPPTLDPWSKVGILDAGHFSTASAYAAIDRHRLDDNHPYIYRTHDGGKHWKLIVKGIPGGEFVNVVREDPKRRGLLYAGTDWAVYVSFDDGDHWQSLQLNLPAASMRDLVFGDNDLVVGTHGRAIWILDDLSTLRELAAGQRGPLFTPEPATYFQRAGTFGFGRFDEGTPLPPEEPQGENRPWGALFDYYVKGSGPVVLKVLDANGNLLRRISSEDKLSSPDPSQLDIPAYWIKPPLGLGAEPGAHRYAWDLRSQSLGNPLVPPGHYTVRLTIGGVSHSRPFTLRRDPRLPVSDSDLQAQYKLAIAIDGLAKAVGDGRAHALALLGKNPSEKVAAKLRRLAGSGPIRAGRRRPAPPSGTDRSSLTFVLNALNGLVGVLESAPAAPSKQVRLQFELLKSKAEADLKELAGLG